MLGNLLPSSSHYASTEDIDYLKVGDEDILDICKTNIIHFNEVHSDNFDTVEKCYTIDAWKTDDHNEEGVVVAKVFDANTVVFTDDEYGNYIDVLFAIENCKKKFT